MDRGTIAVRIANNNPTKSHTEKNHEYCDIGVMFKCVIDKEGDKASYIDKNGITQLPTECREAFIHEIEAFEKGCRNINDIFKYISFRDFGVRVSKNINQYKNLCESYGFPYNKSWNGSGTYYGVDKMNTVFCDFSKKATYIFEDVNEFESYLTGILPKTTENISFRDFRVKLNLSYKDKIDTYQNICKKYNIPIKHWSGGGTYYGIDKDNAPFCSSLEVVTHEFESLKEFEDYLININIKQQENEKNRITGENLGIKRKGRNILSSVFGRTASKARLIRNSIKGRILYKKSGRSEIRKGAIST